MECLKRKLRRIEYKEFVEDELKKECRWIKRLWKYVTEECNDKACIDNEKEEIKEREGKEKDKKEEKLKSKKD